jgi:predicted GNAT superfamily acetyltransferase
MPDLTLDRSLVEAAGIVAAEAAAAAQVRLRDLGKDPAELRALADLFARIWGTGPAGPPINSELLRGFAHADGSIVAAYDSGGDLCGGAVAIRSGRHSLYSLIAGVRSGGSDRGIGYALKHHQRAWALRRGCTRISWTFDPLVARNARFNLVKLGAAAVEYIPNFYGPMADAMNSGGDSDRLTARWALDSPRAVAAAGGARDDAAPPSGDGVRPAPDGGDLLRVDGDSWWMRVPADIVSLRSTDPAQASAWRHAVREVFQDAFARELVATQVTRDSWYHLTPDPSDERSEG